MNLAPTRSRKRASDTKEMVAARLRFLERGFYRPFSDAIADMVSSALERLDEEHRKIIDIGCGPGFYLRGLFAKEIGAAGIIRGAAGLDLSKAAVRVAAKHGGLFAVADVEEGVPVASGGFGVVLSVFAPRPVRELRRIVRNDGVLVVAAAGPEHLIELRRDLGLMAVREDKERVLTEQLSKAFEVTAFDRISFPMDLDEDAVRDLIDMGPNAWHRTQTSVATGERHVTADFLITVARPKS